jgi:hypothetical protein
MARDTTPEEEATRHEMIAAYKVQEHAPDGFNDWGMFTAHVVHAQRIEIRRLHELLQGRGVGPGEWEDPLDGNQ